MTDIKQQILSHLEALPPEQVKTLLFNWLSSSEGDLEDFERLLTNQPEQIIDEPLQFGEINEALNFQPLTEAEMVEKSLSSLEAYRRKGSGVSHERVREWVKSLGTDEERSCPR